MKYNMNISPVDDRVWLNEDCTLLIDADTPEEAANAAQALTNLCQVTEENAKLREVLKSIQRIQSRTPELPDDYSHEDVGLLNDRIDEIFGKVNTSLNQLKEQNNDK